MAHSGPLWQLIVSGLSLGSIYSLVALGMVLGFKTTRVMNFAHGDLVMLAAFLAWWLIEVHGVPFWPAALAVAVVVGGVNMGIESRVVRHASRGGRHATVLATIGTGVLIRGAVALVFGPESRSYPTPWTGQTTRVGHVVVADLNLVILASTVALTTALYAFLQWTRPGLALRAASHNATAARLMGIDVPGHNAWAWAVCGVLAAVCGMLLAPITLVDISLWQVVLKALATVVVGGFGNIAGALLGGLVLGLVEQFSGVYLPDGWKDMIPYAVIVAALLLRPVGLLGERRSTRA